MHSIIFDIIQSIVNSTNQNIDVHCQVWLGGKHVILSAVRFLVWLMLEPFRTPYGFFVQNNIFLLLNTGYSQENDSTANKLQYRQ